MVLISRQSLLDGTGDRKGLASQTQIHASTSAGSDDSDDPFVERWLRLRTGETEIEDELIRELVGYHDTWVQMMERDAKSSLL